MTLFTEKVAAIDVHAHYGDRQLLTAPFLSELVSADAAVVLERARRNNIEWTVVSPLQAIAPPGSWRQRRAGGQRPCGPIGRTDRWNFAMGCH